MDILAVPIRSHRLLFVLVLFCVCLVFAGCRSEYRLEMSVENGAMQRAIIRTSQEDSPPDPVVLPPGRLPDELGDYGWFLHEDTAMGSLNLYVEQFDRFTDPSESLEMRRFATHRLVDVWIAWLDSEFAGERGYSEFRAFVDTEIRADVEDLFFMVWGYGAFGPSLTKFDDEDDAALSGEIAVRGLTYLARRGYFELGDARDVVAAFGRSNKYGNYAAMADFWARAIARRMGVEEDAPLPYPLSALHGHPHQYLGSYTYFVTESLAVRDLVSRWESEYPDFVKEKKPESADPAAEQGAQPGPVLSSEPDVVEEIVFSVSDLEPIVTPEKIDFHDTDGPDRVDAILVTHVVGEGVAVLAAGDALRAALQIPTEPLWTNAHVVDGNRLEWSETFGGMTFFGNEMSTVLYAAWVEPDADYQLDRFGKLVLEGEELASYVSWHMQLKPHHAEEWREFIDALSPGADNVQKLQFFHFSDEPDSVVEIIQDFNAEQEVIGERVVNESVAASGARDIIWSLRSGDEEDAP
jgi:hypothetical protein